MTGWGQGPLERCFFLFLDRIGADELFAQILDTVQPEFWFAAHLHCKFAALVPHGEKGEKQTKFLALDKCLPRRQFLQVLDP